MFKQKNMKIQKLKWSRNNFISVVILVIFYGLFVSQLFADKLKSTFWVFLILIPVAIMLSTSTLIGVARTGFWISSIEDVIPIFLILLTQTTDIYSVIVVVSGLTSFEMCGIYYILNWQVSQKFSVKSSTIKKYSFASIFFTSVLGIIAAVAMMRVNGIGTQNLPAPSTQVFGMTLTGLMESLTRLALPDYINLYVFLISCILCIFLERKTSVSPMVILSGMLLPFGTYIVIGIGAFFAFVLRKNKWGDSTFFSGLSVGDGLISSALCIYKAFI